MDFLKIFFKKLDFRENLPIAKQIILLVLCLEVFTGCLFNYIAFLPILCLEVFIGCLFAYIAYFHVSLKKNTPSKYLYVHIGVLMFFLMTVLNISNAGDFMFQS